MSLSESRIAVLVANGYQEIGFRYPVLRFREEGTFVTVIAPQPDHEYRADLGYPMVADIGVDAASPSDYDAVVLPGHREPQATDAMFEFIGQAWRQGCVIGAAAQAPGTLAMAGLLQGRTVCGAAAVSSTITGGGARYSMDSVVTDNCLVTARSADDLPAFFQALTAALAAARAPRSAT